MTDQSACETCTDFHFGFRLRRASQVDEWKKWLSSKGVPIYEDIARKDHPGSFKIKDPDGYWIEISSESKAQRINQM